MPPSTPAQRGRQPSLFNNNHNHGITRDRDDKQHSSPRSPMTMSKLNIDPKNIDCLHLCMDVPFLDHPYLIGPRGRKSQYFMTRYKSLLHFPDTNCRQDGLKLNNVMISGSMKNVEEIRTQIRLRTPIRVVVQLAKFSEPEKIVHGIEEAIASRSLPIRFNVSDDFKSGVMKTEWRNEDLLVTFCEEFLSNKTMKGANCNDLFTLGMALLPLINPWNQELSHRLIGSIYDQTGCNIFYPPKDKYSVQPPTYFIKGSSMGGILLTGKYLMGLTMLQVTFYMPPGAVPTIRQNQLDDWQRDYLVHTTIYNPEQHGNSSPSLTSPLPQFKVTLRSFEFAINGIYMVRSALLNFKKSVQTTNYDFMKPTKYLVPYTVFMDAKLFYPLYSVDDKNLNWPSHEFFDHFYGGPYQPSQYESNQEHSATMTSHSLLTPTSAHRASSNQKQVAMSMNEESELEHQQQHQPLMSIGNMATPPPPVPKAANGIVQQYTPNDYHVIHLHDIMQQQPSPPQDPTQIQAGNGTMPPMQYVVFHVPSPPQNQQPPYHHTPRADPMMLLQW